jgi:hypothetical protein
MRAARAFRKICRGGVPQIAPLIAAKLVSCSSNSFFDAERAANSEGRHSHLG